ncbi:MAG: chorismate-binding protein [Bacteroidales bacterium]|nr:chorismate-binding protein [Bacteroidales bacterium]
MQRTLNKTYAFEEVLSLCLENKIPFASYRLPGNNSVNTIIQKDCKLTELNGLSGIPERGGFIIAPFTAQDGIKTYIIRPDIVLNDLNYESLIGHVRSIQTGELNGINRLAPKNTNKRDFIQQVRNTIDKIRSGEFDKVVLSRVKIVEGEFTSRLIEIFKVLSDSYTNAFVYLFQVKGHCWIGATPEPLICFENNELTTVSLAGTRTFTDENLKVENWNKKELKEQEYVTQFIENALSDYNIINYQKTGPYTKKAGRLLHLRTDFNFDIREIGDKLHDLINALHPTSAVCGMPMERTREYIIGTEKHEREYYSGFLGPVGIKDKLQLFVNLRCMKVFPDHLALYVGGGITSDSIAEDEWEETEIKAETLLSVVNQIK